MRCGASFAEVLDATLRGYQPEVTVQPATASCRPTTLPPNPFLFTLHARAATVQQPLNLADAMRVGVPSGATVAGSSAAQASASVPREEGARAAARAVAELPRTRATPRAPRRKLTPLQQRSLDAFVDAGASIGPDFSADEVRSAYRRLARRFHPDRHPLAADEEKAALSRQFAAVTSDYEVLLTALDAASC